MNNALTNTTTLTMSSREIAELVEVRHDSVKRAIERLADREVIEFPPSVQIPTATKPVTVYQINKRDSYVIVAQLSPEFTARLVVRWQELEAQAAKPPAPALPGDYLSALKALVASEEEKQHLLTANKEMHDELNLLTVQEYGALTHRYLTQSQRVKLGKKAVALASQQGISLS